MGRPTKLTWIETTCAHPQLRLVLPESAPAHMRFGAWVADVDTAERAAFLVRAANSHEALVEALKHARMLVIAADLGPSADSAIRMYDAALALAVKP